MSASAAPGTVFVLEDFGPMGRAYREAPEEASDRETIIQNIVSGEYERLLRVVAFNTAEGWSRDVTGEIEQEAARRRGAAGSMKTKKIELLRWQITYIKAPPTRTLGYIEAPTAEAAIKKARSNNSRLPSHTSSSGSLR
jgi:hypothetical protein